MRLFVIFIIGLFCTASVFSQQIPLGFPLNDQKTRIKYLNGHIDSTYSYFLRPIEEENQGLSQSGLNLILFKKRDLHLKLLPIHNKLEYNSRYPFSINNGSMIRNVGVQTSLSTGVLVTLGPFHLRIQPEWVISQNLDYQGFPEKYDISVWQTYYNRILNRIDLPERMGSSHYKKLFSGQSGFFIALLGQQVSFSSENLWIGPGVINSLLISNNAAGFRHLKLRSIKPINIWIGSLEYQVIAGQLENSAYVPVLHTDSSRDFFRAPRQEPRILTSYFLSFSPRFLSGLSVGFARNIASYAKDLENNYFSSFTGFFRSGIGFDASDQLAAVYFHYLFQKAKAEVYFEIARNDASWNLRDVLLQPEHSRAYILGFQKVIDINDKSFKVLYERSVLERSGMYLFRAEPEYYVNVNLRQGYTNNGEVIGNGIGPGSNQSHLSVSYLMKTLSFGVLLQRTLYNQDFYVSLKGTSEHENWRENSYGVNTAFRYGKVVFEGRLMINHSNNYQYQTKENSSNPNVTNLHSFINTAFCF